MRSLIAVALLATGSVASASPETPLQVAIAVNAPFRWGGGDAVAGSAYLGLDRHQAIRANVAVYDNTANAAGELIGLAAGGDGDEAYRYGRITDVGVGWMYFPRRLWDGLSFEAGALRRGRSIGVEDEFASPAIVQTHTRTYAVRALIGWSWLIAHRAFVSIAVGASAGYEYGNERTSPMDYPTVYTTHEVGRSDIGGEGFLRLGVAFGD